MKINDITKNSDCFFLLDSQLFYHWTLEQRHHIFPVNPVDFLIPFMHYLHELILRIVAFLVQRAAASVIAEKTYQTSITRHHQEDVSILRLAIQLLTDDRPHTVVFAAHVMEVAKIEEPVESRYVQHSTSRFATSS